MNTLSGILSRELLTPNDKLNILWTSVDDYRFEATIKSLGHNIITFSHLYFGTCIPNAIICNNKVLFYKKCRDISIQFHIPILVIDHETKPDTLADNLETSLVYRFPTSYNVAMSEEIANSWSVKYNYVLKTEDIRDKEFWSNTIYQTSKLIFKYNGKS